ncbi:tRNA modification GTPase [Dysgonomonas sp. PH5-45]|uniref:tRNA uridine-5-carboxymethylaminomethyl(34) synthesis GTPase MnmE n=1 Tax=unclassified Dysgonomonas TaxID=2630389 RepID=UPI0024759202|nr:MULTISPECIES: tRNA uridine-5-carboxymethylaminomethyl(34) synthesis GTPase MnmE [unclassified Dysgonomonas]MDH6353873.1 tRNA modification GTPase [Dysgonomonas sp. PH5-45]MDH6386776.1 tRNA modification GTPase [Dysgonomonas sp. PH5-37]
MHKSDIIAAISTPAGVGGIAIVRLSGKGCIELADSIFRSPKNKRRLVEAKAGTIHFGTIEKDGASLDEVLVSVFRSPNSFTGEDSVEVSCHGSTYIQQSILQLFLDRGARLATAGEFTQRAFLNGRMDLSQAESVADLIASTSAATHRLAMNQMRGGFSDKLVELRTDLLNFTSLIELELDFSEEDVEFANRNKLKESAQNISQLIKKLADSFSLGNTIKTGIPVAIVGETNAGKSTLLNLLLREEKAIVSEIHGTTRDVIEDTINIQGLTFRLIDTAGIRDTDDAIETMGIDRTFQKLEQANIVLWVADAETEDSHTVSLSRKILPLAEGKKLILAFNKVDAISADRKDKKEQLLKDEIPDRIFISAKYHQGTDQLQDMLVAAANIPEFGEQDIVVTNLRHYEALQNAYTAIQRVTEGLENNISGDFLSQDIRECMHYLGEITGHISTDEILGNIFSKFCIGK